jgi:hypothetical protein
MLAGKDTHPQSINITIIAKTTETFRQGFRTVGNVAINRSTHIHKVWSRENNIVVTISEIVMTQNGAKPFPVKL